MVQGRLGHLPLLVAAACQVAALRDVARLTPDPVNGFAIGGGGQPCAGIGGYSVGRPPHNGGRKRLGRRFFGDVEVTETLGQGGDHACPLLAVSLRDRSRWGVTGTFVGLSSSNAYLADGPAPSVYYTAILAYNPGAGVAYASTRGSSAGGTLGRPRLKPPPESRLILRQSELHVTQVLHSLSCVT